MPGYKTRTTSEDPESEYESDGETGYSPVKPLGKGHYARARLFKSKSEKAVTVLNPIKTPADMEEARVKHRFFKTVYPDKQSHLFKINGSYRLIVPYISYEPYNKLTISTPEFQKTLFLSAAQALKDCHDKGMIVIDLKSDNIYYDSKTGKSYLIDGGLSVPTKTPIDSLAFQKSSQKYVEQYKKEYGHIPPECWSVRPKAVLASPKMDIYSLGIVMYDLLENPTAQIKSLIARCLEQNPMNRPTVEELLSSLGSSLEKTDFFGDIEDLGDIENNEGDASADELRAACYIQ